MALVAAAGLLLHYKLQIGLVGDDYVFLGNRGVGGPSTLLAPHSENIVVLQAALYRVMFIIFGFNSAAPFQVLSLVTYLLSIVAFFALIRTRVGDAAAALASIPLLVLGTAYQDLLWAFQVGYSVSAFGGLVALIAIEHGGRFSRVIACVALLVSVTMSSLGLPFLVAAGVMLVLRDGWDVWRRYELFVPAGVFAVWYLVWGTDAPSAVSWENVRGAPLFVAESVKSVVMGLTGLHRLPDRAGDILGWVCTATLTLLTALGLIRRRVLPPEFLAALAAGLTFWVLISLNQIPGIPLREPDASRYQYPGAVFLLMILAGAFIGCRPGRRLITGFAVLAAVSVACSLGPLRDGLKAMNFGAGLPEAAMTALNIAGDKADPNFGIPMAPKFSSLAISQQNFLAVQERYGRGGWTSEEIQGKNDELRNALDQNLIAALNLEISPGASASANCRIADLNADGARVSLTSGTVGISPRRSAALVTVGRFGDGAGLKVGSIAAGSAGTLTIPADQSGVPWRVAVRGKGPARICIR